VIDRISGILAACDLTEIVVDVGGIGFALTVPLSTYDRLPAVGSSVQLFGHLHVREDQFVLYGFADPQERRLFRLLITVSGIGPRMALNVLSCMPITTFCQAVAEGDIKALTRISGFGKRSAERLVVELREKVSEIDPAAALGGSGAAVLSSAAQDAVAALETLGFRGDTARKAVSKLAEELPPSEQTAEEFIRRALRDLNS
jgi:Holliday junction DNA helicase RuvA